MATISNTVRLVFTVLTLLVWAYMTFKVRYLGFIALLIAFTVNTVVKMLTVLYGFSSNHPYHAFVITFLDGVLLVAAIIFAWDFLRDGKEKQK